jgi:hypothetical protein
VLAPLAGVSKAGGDPAPVEVKTCPSEPVAIATGSDGQVLTSTGAGSAPAFEALPGGGKILQVVSTNKTDAFSVTVANDSTLSSTISGFTVAITPVASNSKILILCTGTWCMSAVGAIGLYLFRDTTQINLGDANQTRFRAATGMSYIAETSYTKAISMVHVDSPNTTSEVVYSLKASHTSGSSKVIYLNRDHSYGNNTDMPTSSSNIIAIEIGA